MDADTLKFATSDERELWSMTFVTALPIEKSAPKSAIVADAAVVEYRKRFVRKEN